MTYRNREEHWAASEDLAASFQQSGSVLFSQPSAVDIWCDSVTYSNGFPPTPPDTASDCAPSDCSDMNGPGWSQCSAAEDSWTTAPYPVNSTTIAPSHGWQSQVTPDSTQDVQEFGPAPWLSVSHGPVDMGLSPVLSHESQSSHAFHSISEPELPLLPPGLDLSFISEPAWDYTGSVATYPGSSTRAQDYTSIVSSPYGTSVHSGSCAPQEGNEQPMFAFGPVPMSYPRRAASDSVVTSPRRPLLPRTDGPCESVAYHRPYGHAHVQPHMSGAGRADNVPSVSNAHGHPEHSTVAGFVPFDTHGHMTPVVQQTRTSSVMSGLRSPCQEVPLLHQDDVYPNFPGQASEDSKFAGYDHGTKASMSSMSYARETVPSGFHTSVDGHVKPALHGIAQYPVSSATSMTSESDEGRHRNHPLYSKGPEQDGMYHCPFASDPNCQHRPTKLKCNYDKFIDSHLKPFRCKVEACSKQEFSSTACLLRHEREAHGMHGHGDRPHLCYYPGCERGAPGNGFPRRYNLFDHMKRVHDHKDEPQQDRPAQEPRKVAGRKRKASGSVNEEPAAPRSKIARTVQPGHVQHGSASFAPSNLQINLQQEQQNLYSQWANRKQLLELQMSSVHSPDDEANLQQLSQNVEEFRRISHQARRG